MGSNPKSQYLLTYPLLICGSGMIVSELPTFMMPVEQRRGGVQSNTKKRVEVLNLESAKIRTETKRDFRPHGLGMHALLTRAVDLGDSMQRKAVQFPRILLRGRPALQDAQLNSLPE